MANTKKPQPGADDNGGVTINVNPPRPAKHSDRRQPDHQPQQPENTAEPTPPTSTPPVSEPPKPQRPLYTEIQRHTRPDGTTHTYSPLAATAFARLDTKLTDLQPGELWDYTDHTYQRQGYL